MSDWSSESEDLFRAARRAGVATFGAPATQAERDRIRARIRARIATKVAVAVAAGVLTTSKSAGAATTTATSASATTTTTTAMGGAAATVAKGASIAFAVKLLAPMVVATASILVVPRFLSTRNSPAVDASLGSGSAAVTPAAPPSRFDVSPSSTPSQGSTPALSAAGRPLLAPSDSRPETGGPVVSPARAGTSSGPRDVSSVAPSLPAGSRDRRAVAPTTLSEPRDPAATGGAPPVMTETPEEQEARLVGEIDNALRTSNPAAALRLVAEHQRRFPHGVLAEEREGARVVARCLSGSVAGAAGAARFVAAHPRSPMRARILASCRAGESE